MLLSLSLIDFLTPSVCLWRVLNSSSGDTLLSPSSLVSPWSVVVESVVLMDMVCGVVILLPPLLRSSTLLPLSFLIITVNPVGLLKLSLLLVTFSYYLSSVLYYLLSLLLVLLSLRTNEYNREIEEFKIKLEFNKDSIDNKMLFSLCPNLKQTRAKSNINNLVIKNLFFNSMRNTFSVIFVFILLVAPAAMTYKIIDLMKFLIR